MWPELLFISRETAETAVFIKNDNLCTFALLSIISNFVSALPNTYKNFTRKCKCFVDNRQHLWHNKTRVKY